MSDHPERVKAAFGFEVCGVGLFGGVEIAEVFQLPIERDQRPKFATVARHSQIAGRVVGLRLASVVHILGVRCFAQIRNRVEVASAVNVVYLGRRPLSIDVEPGEAMGLVQAAIDRDYQVPVFSHTPSDIANFNVTRPNAPPK